MIYRTENLRHKGEVRSRAQNVAEHKSEMRSTDYSSSGLPRFRTTQLELLTSASSPTKIGERFFAPGRPRRRRAHCRKQVGKVANTLLAKGDHSLSAAEQGSSGRLQVGKIYDSRDREANASKRSSLTSTERCRA
jgi:hypothetical protein